NDTLAFGAGISASNVYLQESNRDLYFRFRNSADSIRVRSQFTDPSEAIEKAVFVDGTTLDLTKPLTFTWIGTGTNDTLFGSAKGNNVFSETVAGNHIFQGTVNNDTYIYNAG